MKYNVELSDRFKREFKKLDKYTQKIIRSWIDKNLVGTENPRQHGKGLTANRKMCIKMCIRDSSKGTTRGPLAHSLTSGDF